jgi:hypothetical protein
MRRSSLLLSGLVAVVVIAIGVVAALFAFPRSPEGEHVGIPLARAAVSSSFLDNEAGIAAYAKAPGAIDLGAARRGYKIVERETADFVLGWVPPRAGLSDDFNVKVYVSRDGWVVAHHLRDEATSKFIDWGSNNDGTFQTYLEEALLVVASSAGIRAGQVGYYHYGYPTADALLVLVGASTGAEKKFSFTVPSGLAVSDTSWSIARGSSCVALNIQGQRVGDTCGTAFGKLAIATPRDRPTEIVVGGFGYGAIVFVYKE